MRIRLRGARAGRNLPRRRLVRAAVTLPRLDSSALREWERITAGPLTTGAPAERRGTWPLRATRLAAKVLLVAVLPFLLLVRAAVFLYEREGYSTVLALIARRFALPVALAYCAYALIYFSSANAKSERVRAYYASLHPLLRVALSTLILADRDLVVTDLARGPESYAAMGLTPNDGSLHYLQRDGYTHAADLRTAGRGVLKNRRSEEHTSELQSPCNLVCRL